jgi:hypothetical protein
MNHIRRILVAIAEPNARAQPGLDKAAELARRMGAEIDLFHCLYNLYAERKSLWPAGSHDIEMLVQVTREHRAARKPVATWRAHPAPACWDYPAHENRAPGARHRSDLVSRDAAPSPRSV